MARTPSNMMPLGTSAPEFCLPDTVSGKEVCLSDVRGEIATVVMFICNHCPFVKHVQDELVRLGQEYPARGVSLVAVSSNDAVQYPEDTPENMKALAASLGYTFPYLYDETQQVARLYDAACTPDFYVFDQALGCVYRGQLDDSRPGNDIPVTGESLRLALDALLAGQSIDPEQKPSVGCNIKWKA